MQLTVLVVRQNIFIQNNKIMERNVLKKTKTNRNSQLINSIKKDRNALILNRKNALYDKFNTESSIKENFIYRQV
jgi:hypothetical protein